MKIKIEIFQFKFTQTTEEFVLKVLDLRKNRLTFIFKYAIILVSKKKKDLKC
jgi:hypothetical protein